MEEQKIKLDIVSDVVCPWCVIGYKRLEKAIDQLHAWDRVEIEWQPFQLNPHIPSEGENLREHLAKKYGTSTAESVHARDKLTALGAEVGFTFNYADDMRTYNTGDAHVLLAYARQFGLQTPLKLALFTEFFTERRNVSDRALLLDVAKRTGLPVEQGESLFDDPALRQDVDTQQEYWRRLGITGVPTVVMNREQAVSGAYPVDAYVEFLQSAL
ncbi:DsbA family oxidoreductase [Parasalinivibrio latis]|uniref:DsbA family oxidoreductase n=1 Tax=Parasalinivibrio latis TaxID=2952610 RepID=UPI0030DE4163